MKQVNKIVFLSLILFALSAAQTKRPMEPEDVVGISGVSFPQFSPDGKWIAYQVVYADNPDEPGMQRNCDIWIVSSDGKTKPRRLVFGPNYEYKPQWSPNGKYLAFLADRKKKSVFQIYLLNMSGGEPKVVTNLKQGVEDYKWLSDSKTIAFLAKDPLTTDEEKKLSKGYDQQIIGKPDKLTRLYELNLTSRKIKLITKQDKNVNAFDYSNKEDKVALYVSPSSRSDDVTFHSKLVIIDRNGNKEYLISGHDKNFDLGTCWGQPYWSPDDKWISYFIRVGDTYLPAIVSTKTWHAKVLAEDYKGTIWYMNWNPKTKEIFVSSQEGVQGTIGKLDRKTEKVAAIQKVGTPYCEVQTWDISKDGQWITFHAATRLNPDDIWIMRTDGTKLKRLTDMNPIVDSLITVPQEIIHWKSKDGLTIEGLLIKPVNYKKSKRYPLVVHIHGGPTWAWWNGWLAGWHEWAQLLANKGFVVLMPNPRGSNGYGWKFANANVNDWGGKDFEDIMSGVDYLIAQGIADSTRLGIGGWSYGGFMTAMAVAKTNRFKAAVMGASVTDLITMYSTCGRPEEFKNFFGGTPVKREDVYRAHSPVVKARKVSTPTLILHGGADNVVPVTQSYEFYQRLKDLGAKTEFVVYPRESHAIDEWGHQIDVMHRIADWFTYYLKDRDNRRK